MQDLLKKHVLNIKGERLQEKFIVIESDDWGASRIPDKKTSEVLIKSGLLSGSDPYARFDCLETENDLSALFEVLTSFKDFKGRHPVVTGNMVMGNPDFSKIKEENFQEYFFESFVNTYRNLGKRDNNLNLLKEAQNCLIFHPQYHAKEHLNVPLWMKYLKENNSDFKFGFQHNCFAINDRSTMNRRKNLMAAYDYYSKKDLDYIQNSIEEGLKIFENTFGIKSLTTVCPCYVWDENIEEIFIQNGIKTFQGSKYQQIPIQGHYFFKRKLRYNGQEEKGKTYSIRNVLFEPSLYSDIDWVDRSLQSIKIAFQWKKPAVIGSHRINFSGGIDPDNRDRSLKLLGILLKRILKEWPDVKFISSAELSQYYSLNK